jgi:hypothetical protein
LSSTATATLRRRDAINALLVSNLRLSGEKLASELEHRTAQLAEACLRVTSKASVLNDCLAATQNPDTSSIQS